MKDIFLEVIVAPDFDAQALDILTKKKNLRLLKLPAVAKPIAAGEQMVKHVFGGLLIQDQDTDVIPEDGFKVVTETLPAETDREDLVFAMKVVKHVKSNAIVLVKNKQTVGIGPGQPNRITSAGIAISNAGEKAKGAILGSDAFFPFADTVQAAAAAGVAAIIQPGGSMRDQESIDACNQAKIPMVFTGMRHFRH